MVMTPADEARIAKWARGYRTLMKGNLDATVHTACTSETFDPETNTFAELRIEDIEELLETARKARLLAHTSIELRRSLAASIERDGGLSPEVLEALKR